MRQTAEIQDFNLTTIGKCIDCRVKPAERLCASCADDTYLCLGCYQDNHRHGSRRLHVYYKLVSDPALPQGLQSPSKTMRKQSQRSPSEERKSVQDFEDKLQQAGDEGGNYLGSRIRFQDLDERESFQSSMNLEDSLARSGQLRSNLKKKSIGDSIQDAPDFTRLDSMKKSVTFQDQQY